MKSLLLTAFAVLGLSTSLSASAQTDLVAAAANVKGATVTPSGLVYLSLKDGSGASPAASDKVTVQYRGTFADRKSVV